MSAKLLGDGAAGLVPLVSIRTEHAAEEEGPHVVQLDALGAFFQLCLLYTSDAADDCSIV